MAGERRPPKRAAEKAVTIRGAAINASAPCLHAQDCYVILLAGRFLLFMVEVDRLVTCQLLGFDNLFQGRLNSHSMAPQGNLHVSGQGGCGPEDASHLQFLGRPEQQGSVRESACAHPRRVRLNISCHNLSSDNFAYHAPPPPFFGPIIFLPGPFLVGGSCRRPRPEGWSVGRVGTHRLRRGELEAGSATHQLPSLLQALLLSREVPDPD